MIAPIDIDPIHGMEDPRSRERQECCAILDKWAKQSWLRLSEHIPANDKWSVCRVQAAAICDSRLK
jgi:hypothetical protein